jgi:acyl-CoA thioester hydrolase
MKHTTEINVRFCETDALGHVNNVSYFIYLEQGRTGFIKAIGSNRTTSQWSFILAATKCDFMAQAYFDQDLEVTTFVSKIGNKSFRLSQEIFDVETGKQIAKAESTLIYFDFEKQQSEPIPQHLRGKLQLYYMEDESLNHSKIKG